MTKSPILIIGGAGYIGSHVTIEFCDAGFPVYVFDDLSSGHLDNIDKRAKFIEGSILNKKQLTHAFKISNSETVIHLAALKGAGESMIVPHEYSEKNITGTINILETMIKENIRNVVFSSSAAVYGNPEYLPLDENHPLNPVNYYGFTKLIIENLLEWYGKLMGINFAILRYFNAVGYDMQGRVNGIEKTPSNLFPIIMETICGLRDSIEIFGNDYNTKDGTCERDYIHVSDLADAHLRSVEYLLEEKKNFTTNLATGKKQSVMEVVNNCEKISKIKIPFSIEKRRVGDVPQIYAESLYSESLLNWKPHYKSLSEMTKSMLIIYKRNSAPTLS